MTQGDRSAEDLIREHAPAIAEQIKKAAQEAWGNEAQFRGNLARGRVLEGFAEHLELNLQPREEYTLINGRADAVYNRFVIEYEPPGSLTERDSQRNRHAIGQVRQYLEGLAKVQGHKPERLGGVATDGCYFVFARFRGGVFHVDPPLPVTADSTARFLASLYLLSTEKALTAENLVRDFGENSNVARVAVSTLYRALSNSQNPKVRVIYDQWREQFSEVCGYEKGSPRLDLRALARQYAIQDANPNAFGLFFAIHTYYAAFIKLLAIQVIHHYMAPKLGTGLPQVASYSDDRLQTYLKDMERGGIFKHLGIGNFLEGDFFGWYLEIWDDALDRGIRRIVSELASYSLVTLDADHDQTRDLLKKLYQNVMPKQLRHDLGEYYTPDWLAERLLNQLGFTSQDEPRLHEKRILDPACGSGTFLVLAIKRVKEHCVDRPITQAEVLQRVLANIVGFDLNPLAVITARTNYLLALGDLLSVQRSFEVNLPVYTCDSILTPSQAEGRVGDQYRMVGPEERLYRFKTVVGDFAIPGSLISAQYVDTLAGLIEECVDAKYSVADFRKRLLQTFPLAEGRDDSDVQVLEQVYTRIRELDEKAINGIWARIIKNAFAPLFCGHFDYVAGNPPWVNWEHLPDEYRQRIIPLYDDTYGLFPHTGFRARHGSTRIDISTLMLYVAMHVYLTQRGKLGFVITQAVFKTDAAAGFRRFRLPNEVPLKALAVDDMSHLQPFEGVGNRTSLVILEKGKPTRYPVTYNLWWKKVLGIGIGDDFPLARVNEIATYRKLFAEPVNEKDPTSPWLTGRRMAVKAVRKILGRSDYVAHAGICGWANSVYWVDLLHRRPDGLVVVSNITAKAKKKVQNMQTAVEPDFLFPLLRSGDVTKWQAVPSAWILVAQDPSDPKHGYPVDRLQLDSPKTYSYLQLFQSELANRPGYIKYLSKEPFYAQYDVKAYTFASHKVVWTRMAKVQAAVVGTIDNKVIIPQETVTLVACTTKDEAHYIASLVNSAPFQYATTSYSQAGGKSMGSMHVLENICVPDFDPGDRIHQGLASSSDEAHQAATEKDQQAVALIEKRIDELAAEMWGLTKSEMEEILTSLAELKS